MSGFVQARRSAELRTRLMHRMLVARRFAELGAAVPMDSCRAKFGSGEEAVAAGTWAALGPADTVIRHPGRVNVPPEAGVMICLADVRESDALQRWLDSARRRDRHALAARLTISPSGDAVDALDVEAVFAAMRLHLDELHAGGPPRLVELRLGDADPITTLAQRMFVQRQLDENALRAIDADTRAYVRAVLASGRGGRR
ncbi:hypothetical protein [Paractinoplanes atraurantiacus]|uniref:Uncharacterized protein n=1 Tax=Paractinoplanes atraurantiacus TaxID=1036182 RepID=A0A285JIS0_9ACTN|nr:hypothetical protein [Actinoplanes atraurantiacus]SNY59276.1 hypothetical protein SAMN05421748_12099 [Actinoplanes atraurantiacus]